jgi:hypothetical protein
MICSSSLGVERLVACIQPRELIGKLRRTRVLHRGLLPTKQEDDDGDKGHDLADKQDV